MSNDPATSAPGPALDDRVPYDVAEAVIRTLALHGDQGRDEQAVIDAIRAAKGPESSGYLAAIERTRHSIFYHQLQELYEFARVHVPPALEEQVCFLAGGEFARAVLAENPSPLEQVVLAGPGSFQSVFVGVVRDYMTRFAGDSYAAEVEPGSDGLAIRMGWRDPSGMRAYLEQYGCDPERAGRNSLGFIAGAVEHFVSRLTAGYEPERFRVEWEPDHVRMHVPVREDGQVNYDTLIQAFAGRLRELEQRQREDSAAATDSLSASTPMRATWNRLRRAARSEELILLRGESGTGKSFLARHVHELSGRRGGPFVEVALTSDVGSDNLVQSDLFGHERGAFTGAAAQKQGLFSLADGGTIFLDEIGDASPELQARLLRVLETGRFKRLGGVRDLQVDVRVIAATNRELEAMVDDGRFRQDLYFRLNVIPVHVPPLRERGEEIPELARYLLDCAQAEAQGPRRELPGELAERLRLHSWPGNVRELEHAMRHAVAMAEGARIQPEDLPEAVIASLEAGGEAAPPAPAATPRRPADKAAAPAAVVDVEALRRAIRETNPLELASADRTELHLAHIDHARRVWLATLIEECHGDLSLMAAFWDRGSEKTLRNLVRRLGLAEHLSAARARHRAR